MEVDPNFTEARENLGVALFKQGRIPEALTEWRVLIREHHPGYITWQQFERNQQRLAENAFMTATTARKSARGGRCLLAGLLRCARCGHMLHVAYARHHDGRYECRQMYKVHAAPRCIGFTARRIDAAIRDQIIDVVRGPALEAAVDAVARLEQRSAQEHQALKLELEQARYEAQLAERRYEAVDPEQRLVAVELEARWNAALQRVGVLEQRLADASCAPLEVPTVNPNELQSHGGRPGA